MKKDIYNILRSKLKVMLDMVSGLFPLMDGEKVN